MTNQNTLADLSSTAALNLNIKGQSQQGTAPASTIDSIFQKYGASLHDFYNSLGGVATVSGTDTYTVTITEDWAALASGLILAIKVPNANTGASTLNVTVPTAGALGAKAIRRQGDSALSANDMVANGVYLLRYDAAYNSSAGAWVLLNPAATQISTPISVANGGTNISSFTAGDIIYASAATTLSKLAKGTAYQKLRMNSGATAPEWADGITLGTATASTSGTSIDFTGIPSGVRRIVVTFIGVSLNGSANFLIQIGSGSVDTSGYVSGSSQNTGSSVGSVSSTAGFIIDVGASGNSLSGSMALHLQSSSANSWAESLAMGFTNQTGGVHGGGSHALSGAIDRVRITSTNGTDTFDAGSVNISYEF